MKDVLLTAEEVLKRLAGADVRAFKNPSDIHAASIIELWNIFQVGICDPPPAAAVAITKAIMLVTEGRIGPALDINVWASLGLKWYSGGPGFVDLLQEIAVELERFEKREGVSIERLVPLKWQPVAVGRALDMLLGPRERL